MIRDALSARRGVFFVVGLFPDVQFAFFDQVEDAGQFADDGRNEFERVRHRLAVGIVALDAVEHGRIQYPESQFRVRQVGLADQRPQTGQFRLQPGIERPVACAGRRLQQLGVQVL